MNSYNHLYIFSKILIFNALGPYCFLRVCFAFDLLILNYLCKDIVSFIRLWLMVEPLHKKIHTEDYRVKFLWDKYIETDRIYDSVVSRLAWQQVIAAITARNSSVKFNRSTKSINFTNDTQRLLQQKLNTPKNKWADAETFIMIHV